LSFDYQYGGTALTVGVKSTHRNDSRKTFLQTQMHDSPYFSEIGTSCIEPALMIWSSNSEGTLQQRMQLFGFTLHLAPADQNW
jgi:hypothetical protein